MDNHTLLTPEAIRQLLRYDPDTGKLYWRKRSREWFKSDRSCASWNARDAETEAFTARHKDGYLQGAILGKGVLAHRAAWSIFYGEWPINEIDHINCIKHDNRIANLRDATRSQNNWNRSKYQSNTSGYKGVTWSRNDGMWVAQIRKFGKLHRLGLFVTAEAASAAYAAAAKGMHGEFFRL